MRCVNATRLKAELMIDEVLTEVSLGWVWDGMGLVEVRLRIIEAFLAMGDFGGRADA